MKKALKVILIVFIGIAAIGAAGVFYITHGLSAGEHLEISPVSPAALDDGVYNGIHSAGRWTNEVAVTVEDGKISGIQIVRDIRFADSGTAGEVFRRVLEAQNTAVDSVAGATVTSKAYLKAIENALRK
jgi:uncharacterized protein with FMN-binding domain